MTNTKGFMRNSKVPMTVNKLAERENYMRKSGENQMRPSAYNITGGAGLFNAGHISGGRFT